MFAVVGTPIQHSLSPSLHNLLFQAWGVDDTYLRWEVLPHELETAVAMFRRNLAGFNVTAPHKKSIIPYLDGLHFSAELYGAVNTVKNESGQLIGYNTDGIGFLRGLDELDYDLHGTRVLLLGAGGAAQTVALELALQGCVFTIANREVSRAYTLQVLLENRFPGVDVEITDITRIPRHPYDVVINATPVGMGDLQGETPLASHYLHGVKLVYDLIYNPARTKLLQLAQEAGCQTVNGLGMLVHQGMRAQEIWQDREVEPQLAEQILEAMAKELYGHD